MVHKKTPTLTTMLEEYSSIFCFSAFFKYGLKTPQTAISKIFKPQQLLLNNTTEENAGVLSGGRKHGQQLNWKRGTSP